MPRRPRVEAPGGVHHVTGRSAGDLWVFEATDDCRHFIAGLAQATAECGWRVHAYCLMTNHFHLLLGTPEANLGAGMRHVQGVFAQRFNRRLGRQGSVWGERFHSRVVESEAHGMLTAAYIVLNPVKASLVRTPAEWHWSSYRATAGLEPVPPFLAADAMLSWLTPDIERARMRYRNWIEAATARLAEARAARGGQSPTGTVPEQPRDTRKGQSPAGTVPGAR